MTWVVPCVRIKVPLTGGRIGKVDRWMATVSKPYESVENESQYKVFWPIFFSLKVG